MPLDVDDILYYSSQVLDACNVLGEAKCMIDSCFHEQGKVAEECISLHINYEQYRRTHAKGC
jgi:hypothetical protein